MTAYYPSQSSRHHGGHHHGGQPMMYSNSGYGGGGGYGANGYGGGVVASNGGFYQPAGGVMCVPSRSTSLSRSSFTRPLLVHRSSPSRSRSRWGSSSRYDDPYNDHYDEYLPGSHYQYRHPSNNHHMHNPTWDSNHHRKRRVTSRRRRTSNSSYPSILNAFNAYGYSRYPELYPASSAYFSVPQVVGSAAPAVVLQPSYSGGHHGHHNGRHNNNPYRYTLGQRIRRFFGLAPTPNFKFKSDRNSWGFLGYSKRQRYVDARTGGEVDRDGRPVLRV